METPSACDCSATNKYRLIHTPSVQLRQNCAPKIVHIGQSQWALTHHVNSRDIVLSIMVVQIQWSRERPCVYRRPPLNHQGTYPYKLANVENVLAQLHKAGLKIWSYRSKHGRCVFDTTSWQIGTDHTWGYHACIQQVQQHACSYMHGTLLPLRKRCCFNVLVPHTECAIKIQWGKGQTSSPCDKNNQSKIQFEFRRTNLDTF